jgi:hypothetical protein
VKQAENVPALLDEFFKSTGKPKVLELESSIDLNKTVFEKFKQNLTQAP